MSLFDRVFPGNTYADALPPLYPQLEAWADDSHLEDFVIPDLTGAAAAGWVGRRGAMRVPAVARGRHLTCTTIAALPLRALRGAEVIGVQPYWCYGTDGQTGDLSTDQQVKWKASGQSPWYRMLWTVDDLLFHGESLWLATRLDPVDARPQRMIRVPFESWTIDSGKIIDADNDPFPPDRLVYIPGPHDGLLDHARDTIAQAAALERTAGDVARRPFRLELHQTTAAAIDDDERRALVAETRRALADNEGILWTNAAVQTIEHRMDSTELLIGGRNAAALDVARHISMPAAMIDATTQGSSLEYQTIAGRNQQWLDYGLSLFLDAIAARLSMDDVVPGGQRVAFDTTDLTAPTASTTGPTTED